MKMKAIFVDYENGVISISSAFKKKAFTPGTREYRELNSVRRDFPDFDIQVRQFKTNTNQDRYRGLTYDFMSWYIEEYDKEHSAEICKALEDMKNISKCHSVGKRYPTIKSWFLERYPEVAKFGMNEKQLAKWEEKKKAKAAENVTSLPADASEKAA